MIIFNGNQVRDWKIWGLWFKKKYFIGFSIVSNPTTSKSKSKK